MKRLKIPITPQIVFLQFTPGLYIFPHLDLLCLVIHLRVEERPGHIPVNKQKFPSGFAALTDSVHKLGLKLGIYTSVSAVTCGGFMGSLGHEEADATHFVDLGFDLVKYDTCGVDCGIHDGCIQNAVRKFG